MYCKECGQEYKSDKSDVCLNCGVKKGNGQNYCDNCGTQRNNLKQDVCLSCGKNFKKSYNDKNKLVSLLLCLFLGGLGAHNFYVGNNGKGILYICLTLGVFLTFGITSIVVGIMIIIDFVKILTNKFEDSNGNMITEWS